MLGGVFMQDTDGNIGTAASQLSEKICGMLFDVATPGAFANKVIEITSLSEAEEAGVTASVFSGVPHYHLEQFYNRVGGSAKLYLAFATCGANDWSVLENMQKAANGQIGQFGIYTEKELFTAPASQGAVYGLSAIVNNINTVMATLANTYYSPASAVLFANPSRITPQEGTATTIIELAKIPTCIANNCRYVSVAFGQSSTTDIHSIQANNAATAPVGCMGVLMAVLTQAGVGESIGHVAAFNLQSMFNNGEFELGFGNAAVITESSGAKHLTDATAFETLSMSQLNALDDKGYIFPVKYAGANGVFFNADTTCGDATGDYRTIARNRTINKSRRLVRANLLPFVNSPFKVDPATGFLSAAQTTLISNAVKDALNLMLNSDEISAIGSVTVPANQNILQNDKVILRYSLIPLGCSKAIEVTEGFALNA